MIVKGKEYQELLMEGRSDDGRFGRGAFADWVAEDPLLYEAKYLVRPHEAISLSPKDRAPLVLEEYGRLFISQKLSGTLTLSSGVSTIPPDHEPLPLRRQNCEEALYVIQGGGTVEIENEKYDFDAGDAVFLPAWAKHRVANTREMDLRVLFFKGIAIAPAEDFGEVFSGNSSIRVAGPDSEASMFSGKPWKYWNKVVVSERDRLPHYTQTGGIASSPGQQGYNYISPANVNSFTLRLVGGQGPAARLSSESNKYAGWTVSTHNTEEIHYCLEGEGILFVNGEEVHFQKGDMTFAPARSLHRIFPKDKNYREMCATGIRFRPFEGLTESAIDQREYKILE